MVMENYWLEGWYNFYIDVWWEVMYVDGFEVLVNQCEFLDVKFYFVNLGGYQCGVFDELYFKMLMVVESMGEVVKWVK